MSLKIISTHQVSPSQYRHTQLLSCSWRSYLHTNYSHFSLYLLFYTLSFYCFPEDVICTPSISISIDIYILHTHLLPCPWRSYLYTKCSHHSQWLQFAHLRYYHVPVDPAWTPTVPISLETVSVHLFHQSLTRSNASHYSYNSHSRHQCTTLSM